jgi:glyoxylate reductase
MNGARVFITRKIPEEGFEVLKAADADVTVCQEDEEQGVPRASLLNGVRNCDVLLSLLTESVDREVLSANPRLLGVATMAVGYNNIDVVAATDLGIPVTNTPGVLTESTADLTWALILAVARRVPEAHNYMVAGRYRIWGPNLFLGEDVSPGASGQRKVLGIIGYGRIGRAVAKRAIGFDMDVIAYDPFSKNGIQASPHARWADLEDLLRTSDFVTLHPLLTPETHHMIGAEQLRTMKPSSYLINVARGPVVDEGALVRALSEGWIAGAGLDVYEDEPRMASGLAEMPNAVLLPHIASASRDTRGMMANIAATNALAHLRCEHVPHVVNPEVYESDAYRERIRGTDWTRGDS